MQYSTNYKIKLMEGTDEVKRQDFIDNFTIIDTQMKNIDNKHSAYGTTIGTNSYTVNLTGVTSYYDGLKVVIKIGTTCTGACSININNLGAKTILDGSGNAITSGSLKAGIPYNLCYNGTNFILLGKGGGGGTATANQILNGYTATTNSGLITGAMADRGAVTSTLNCGGSYTIPEGYHNGSGKVTANSLTSQTSATATAAQILNGQTAFVNGSKITGTMPNRGNTAQTTSWCPFNSKLFFRFPTGYYSGGNFDGDAQGGAECFISFSDITNGLGITSDKIVAGNEVLGVVGTGSGLRKAEGTMAVNSTAYVVYSASSLSFTPKIVYAYVYQNAGNITYKYIYYYSDGTLDFRPDSHKGATIEFREYNYPTIEKVYLADVTAGTLPSSYSGYIKTITNGFDFHLRAGTSPSTIKWVALG